MSNEGVKDFTDLIAWQKAHQLILLAYRISKDFPVSEQFALTNQFTRATVSVTSNIAEGFGRATVKDKRNFYVIAKGSVLELRSQAMIAKDLGYLDIVRFNEFEQNAVEVIRLISGIIRSAQDAQ
jgi:four helix bundle protein